MKRRAVKKLLICTLKEGVDEIKGGENTFYIKNDRLHLSASTPRVKLEGQEGGAMTLSWMENAGKMVMYDEGGGTARTKFDGSSGRRTLPTIRYDELDSNAKRFDVAIRIPADAQGTNIWERPLYYAPVAVTVVDGGIVPEADMGLGAGTTNYMTLSFHNRATDGAGTITIASKNFNFGTANDYDYQWLGTVSNTSITAGQAITCKKTVTGTGEIVPASLLALRLERAA